LHRVLSAAEPGAGSYKAKDNLIVERDPKGKARIRFTPVPADRTPTTVRQWLLAQHAAEQEGLDPLLGLCLAVLDLTCIHPFRDGNGRVSRLWTVLLAYQHGLTALRYVSLERLIEDSKERYYSNLAASSQGWHQCRHDPWPWIHYQLWVLLTAHQTLEQRLQGLRALRGDKTQLLRNAILVQTAPFSAREVAEAHPGISAPTLRKALESLRREGRLQLLSRGRDAKWMVINT
jgi:Fic family protein